MPLQVRPSSPWLADADSFLGELLQIAPQGGAILLQGWAVAEVGFLPEVFHVEGLPKAGNDQGKWEK